jgi:hypothetical protein
MSPRVVTERRFHPFQAQFEAPFEAQFEADA